jgi:Polysaccharide lyase
VRLVLCAVAVLILAALVVGLRGQVYDHDPGPVAPTGRSTPAGPGAVVFSGDFETGDPSQWTWGAQCANGGVPSSGSFARGTIIVQSETVAQGRYGARFDLPAATTANACEVLRQRTLDLDEEWYALEFRLPLDWQEPSPTGWGMEIAQLNFQNIWGPPVGLYAHADGVRLILSSGLCRPAGTPYPPGPGCTNNSGPGGNLAPMYVIPTAPELGVWHQVLVHVKWAKDNSGLLQVFHRKRGESAWEQQVTLSGKPTVQWTTTLPPDPANWTADKIGAYRGQSTAPLSVWHDNFCIATTRALAESCF